MTESERALVRLSAVLCTRDARRLGQALDEAAEAAEGRAVEEVLLQSHLFLGFPAALQALVAWRERQPHAAAVEAEDPPIWAARGEEVCARVYGGQYERLRSNVARLHPDVERWMVVDGYGKVLGRRGLDLRARELCIIGLLVGQDAPQQLYAHLRGALNVGAPEHSVEMAIEIAGAEAGVARLASARAIWASVLERRGRAGAPAPEPRQG